jgi:hypothetical protein
MNLLQALHFKLNQSVVVVWVRIEPTSAFSNIDMGDHIFHTRFRMHTMVWFHVDLSHVNFTSSMGLVVGKPKKPRRNNG